MNKFTKSIIILLSLSSLFAFVMSLITQSSTNTVQTVSAAVSKDLTTYEYKVTEVNESGVYGDSTKDQTGIFLTPDTIGKLNIKEGNVIQVSFDNDNWEQITNVSIVN